MLVVSESLIKKKRPRLSAALGQWVTTRPSEENLVQLTCRLQTQSLHRHFVQAPQVLSLPAEPSPLLESTTRPGEYCTYDVALGVVIWARRHY